MAGGKEIMREGMLWFNGVSDQSLEDKIRGAGKYYKQKYGVEPNLCFINPSMAVKGLDKVDDIEVRETHSVLPNHFWIGVSSK
jgi:hypothetical protein